MNELLRLCRIMARDARQVARWVLPIYAER